MRFINSRAVQQWDYRRAIWAKFMHVVRPCFMLCRVTFIEIDKYPPITGLGGGLTMRKATRDDLASASDENPDQLSPTFVTDALARGDYCVGAFDGSRMVAWAWASFDKAPHGDGLWVKVEPPNMYGYKWYTKPEYRGQGIIGQLATLRDKMAAETGVTLNVGFTETHNYASWQSQRRLGNRSIGYAGYFRLFGKSYPFRTPGVVKHTFRFFRP
jgi:GNAT superfamily N-acetyltransferase